MRVIPGLVFVAIVALWTAACFADSKDTKERMLKPEDLKGFSWRSIGPANMGGRVADIALAPGSSKTFCVAFGIGGVFKTTNAGTTFSPIFDKQDNLCVGSVAIADAGPEWKGWDDELKDEKERPAKEKLGERGKGKIVWVGTGEGNGRNSSSWGTGIFRSTDGGGSFKKVGLEKSADIPRVAIDPRNPDVCYAAALGRLWGPNKERGVYKTDDGGKSWKHVLSIDEHTGCVDVVVNPKEPDTVYAAMYMRRRTAWSYTSGGAQGGIYRSNDGGKNWQKLGGGLPGQTGRIGLDIYAKDPKIVYAVIESDEGGSRNIDDDRSRKGGVFRSEDGGDTWVRMHPRAPRAFYFSKIRVDPTDDKRVYLIGYSVDVSDDGGKTFRGGLIKRPHGDVHTFVVDPADHDHLLMGTDGGIYQSFDRGESWDFLDNIAAGQLYNLAFDMGDPYRVAGGLQDNGSWVGPSSTLFDTGPPAPGMPAAGITNADWRTFWGGDGFHVAFDATNPNILYGEAQGGEIGRIDLSTGRAKSIRPAPKEGQPRFRFNWNSPFFVSPHNPTTLYLGGNYVFKLTNRGDDWARISPDLSGHEYDKIDATGSEAETYGTVVSLAESPLQAGILWAGTDDGLIHVSHDDGAHWENVTPKEVHGSYVARIEPSYHSNETAYVAIDGHRSDHDEPLILMTTDGGRSWSTVTGDLPKSWPVHVVREDRRNPNVLYAGTETGLFMSIDRGRHWIRMNGESLPPVPVHDIQQHPRDMDLIVGTHGRSIYIMDDASAVSDLNPEIAKSEFHVFAPKAAKPREFASLYNASDRVFLAPNAATGAHITYWLKERSDDPVSITIEDSGGHTVRKLTGSANPGFNRASWDLQREEVERLPNSDEAPGEKIYVPAGDYKIKLSCGKHKGEVTLKVLQAAGQTP